MLNQTLQYDFLKIVILTQNLRFLDIPVKLIV